MNQLSFFFFSEWNVSEFGKLSFPGHIISELHIMANRIFDFWVFDEVEQKGWFLSFAFISKQKIKEFMRIFSKLRDKI